MLTDKLRIGNYLAAVDADKDGDFKPLTCSAESDHYVYDGKPVCPDSAEVKRVLGSIGLSKLWGKMDELEILVAGAEKYNNTVTGVATGVRLLGTIKDEQAKAMVKKAFENGDAYVRRTAIGAMHDNKDESAIPLVLKALTSDPDGDVRKEAGFYFMAPEVGEGDEKITIALADALKNDPDPDVRYNAVQALAFRRQDVVTSQLFLDAVETEENSYVRSEMLSDLGHCLKDTIALPVLVLYSSEYEKDDWARFGAEYGLNALLAYADAF